MSAASASIAAPVIAPDLPGFGLSDMPSPADFPYGFAIFTEIVDQLLEQLGAAQYALYAEMVADRLWADFTGHRDFNRFTEQEAEFIAQQDTLYLASVSETDWQGGHPDEPLG